MGGFFTPIVFALGIVISIIKPGRNMRWIWRSTKK